MKKYLIPILAVFLSVVSVSFADSLIAPHQGGTGISTSTGALSGYVLTVSSTNPFIYKLAPSATGFTTTTIAGLTATSFNLFTTTTLGITTSSPNNIYIGPNIQFLSGNGTSTQVAYYNSANTLTSSAHLTTDGTNLTADGTTTLNMLDVTSYIDYMGTTTPPTTPSGHVRVYAITQNGVTRLEQASDNGFRLVYLRDGVQRAKNNTGGTLTIGQAVYVNGAGAGTAPNVGLASPTAISTAGALGLWLSSSTPNNQFGTLQFQGIIGGVGQNLDTSAFSVGDDLFLSATTPGALTNVAPLSPNLQVFIGVVTVANANNGQIFLHVAPFHDVISTLQLPDLTKLPYASTTHATILANTPIFASTVAGTTTLSLGINAVSSTRAINTAGALLGGGDLSQDRTLYFGGSFASSGASNISIASTSGNTWTFSQATSSGSTNGFLSSTDWTTFNGKQSSIAFPLPFGSSTHVTILANAPIFAVTSNGTTTLSLGINAVSSTRAINTAGALLGGGDLSADRTLYFGGTFASSGASGLQIASSSGNQWTWSMATSASGVSGFLSGTDWTTFNGKQNNIAFPLPFGSSTHFSAGQNITINSTVISAATTTIGAQGTTVNGPTFTLATTTNYAGGFNISGVSFNFPGRIKDIDGIATTSGVILEGNGTTWTGVDLGAHYVSSTICAGGLITCSASTGAITLNNSANYVSSTSAGTGIQLSGSIGAVTITNIGVTSLGAATGTITLNAPLSLSGGALGLSITAVSSSRQIIAGAGLLGGGDLSADRTLGWNASEATATITALTSTETTTTRASIDSVYPTTAGGDLTINATTTITNQHLNFKGTAPTIPLNQCGTGPAVIASSTDNAGSIKVGLGTASCKIAFNQTWAGTPFCVVSYTFKGKNSQEPYNPFYATSTTSNLTFTASSTINSGDIWSYICMGPR